MDKTRFSTASSELDYWAEIERAAKNSSGAPEHDCSNIGSEPQGCQVCVDYEGSRKFWVEQKSKQVNQTLEL